MRRDELEHLIRASAAILGVEEVIVVGSQAILGSVADDLPDVVTASVEADILPLDDPDEAKADLVDGSIGEGSLFHETFGVYAQGVGARTARLPRGWRERLVPLRGPGTHGATGWCLEPHDLVVAKLLAGRPKDHGYVRALVRAGVIDVAIVEERLAASDAHDEERRVARAVLREAAR